MNMQAVMRLVPWMCACVLAIAVGCANQSQTTGVTPQKKTAPCGSKTKSCPAQLTAGKEQPPAAKQPPAAVRPATTAKPSAGAEPTNAVFDKEKLAARIREVASKQAGKPALNKGRSGGTFRKSAMYYARKLANLHPMSGKYVFKNFARASQSLPYPPAPARAYATNPTVSQ